MEEGEGSRMRGKIREGERTKEIEGEEEGGEERWKEKESSDE